jgi:hypothetical protein
MELLVYVSPT